MKGMRYLYIALIFGFLLGISDGYIALWKDGTEEPLQVFPYHARLLPLADQQALEKGIPIDTPEELNRLMEDYLS